MNGVYGDAPATLYYQVHDRRLSTVALLTRYGDAVEAYTYEPFGETTIYSIASGVFTQETTSPLGNVFQFTSQ